MADKMLRMAGRGEDGKAKALKTDNDGNLNVQLTGSKVELYADTNQKTINGNDEFVIEVPGGFHEVEFSYRFNDETLKNVVIDHYIKSRSGSSVFYLGRDEIIKNDSSSYGSLTVKQKGDLSRIRIQNISSESLTVLAMFVLGLMGDKSKEHFIDNNKKPVSLSTTKDNSGQNVLRIVDAAPFAYDSLDDALRIKETKKTNHLIESGNDVLISANTHNYIAENKDLSDFSKIVISIRWSAETDFECNAVFSLGTTSYGYRDQDIATAQFYTVEYTVKSGELNYIDIYHTGATDVEIVGYEVRGIK